MLSCNLEGLTLSKLQFTNMWFILISLCQLVQKASLILPRFGSMIQNRLVLPQLENYVVILMSSTFASYVTLGEG